MPKQIEGRVALTDAERQTLAEIGKKLGKQALEEVATIVKPDTLLAWHCKLVAQKFDSSEQLNTVGRPRVDKELEDLVVQMAKENRGWGYDRIAGALAELGYGTSDQTVGNILKRRGLPIAPERKKTMTRREFIRKPGHRIRMSVHTQSRNSSNASFTPQSTQNFIPSGLLKSQSEPCTSRFLFRPHRHSRRQDDPGRSFDTLRAKQNRPTGKLRA